MESDYYHNKLELWQGAGLKTQISLSALNFGQGAIVTIGVTAIMILSAKEVAAGNITIGDLVLINTLMLQLFIPLSILGSVYRQLQYSLADMDLVIKLLDKTPEIVDAEDAKPLQISSASIRFRDVVPQDTVLFNDTIRYNIAYAKPDATDDEVMAAADSAELTELLSRLPEGLDTVVGERGLKLSGGEKQRLAISRVILKAPKIIVFDEATSSLDSQSERAILDALNKISSDATTMVIAHRLSTVVDADEIVVMENGRIVESGTHANLLSRQGLYHRLWEMQKSDPALNHDS